MLFKESFHCIFVLEETISWTDVCNIQEDLNTFLKEQNAKFHGNF